MVCDRDAVATEIALGRKGCGSEEAHHRAGAHLSGRAAGAADAGTGANKVLLAPGPGNSVSLSDLTSDDRIIVPYNLSDAYVATETYGQDLVVKLPGGSTVTLGPFGDADAFEPSDFFMSCYGYSKLGDLQADLNAT